MFHKAAILSAIVLCQVICFAEATSNRWTANRLTYLDETDPFYPGIDFPKLTTPQWIGEPGVEAVVVLAIDDMTQPDKWEQFVRPILQRLKQIDGRAALSIMTVRVDPSFPQLQSWLAEGVSLETHTLTHPCPCLAKRDFQAAASNYHSCVELMNQIPGNHPVAFRMPCCDSMNSPSPRFYAEIFNQTSSKGQFLTIDSSVMNVITAEDQALPISIRGDRGGERFGKYLPFSAFTTTIENYPYPYVIGRLCWEFPAAVPSDWEAQHVHGTNNPVTVADWKAALDGTVIKQGTLNLIFHPHGWIRPDQLIELIDYAVARYGRKVKFLNFREAQLRLDQNLLHGQPLRANDGKDNGVRLVDLNGDGYLDVILANKQPGESWVWKPRERAWERTPFPVPLVIRDANGRRRCNAGARFGVIRKNQVSVLALTETNRSAWTYVENAWVPDPELINGLELDQKPIVAAIGSEMVDQGVRLRDLDGDGQCEVIISHPGQNAIFGWSEHDKRWKQLPYSLPDNTSIVDANGNDAGLRFVDVNEDGLPDVLFSNETRFSLHLFIAEPYLGFRAGWSREVLAGKAGELGQIPMISRQGRNNGAWFRNRHLWVQNEETANLPDKVERRSFDSLLTGLQPPALSPEESLKSIRVKEGFKVEVVAHEPLIRDPIAFDWGADGKLWVVEMGDYPLGLDGKGKPGGIIRFLEDTNHDGIYDRSTVFLEGLNFPTGVTPWRDGVLVSASPEIFYAEDTNGDGRADRRRVLLSGFNEGNQQHRVNGFDYGLDNWFYGANGDSGGHVRSEKTGKEIDISGRDFRFRPGDGAFEAESGNAQYGRHRDDWGNWFGNNNSTWIWHYFFPEQYLVRNPQLAIRSSRRTLARYRNGSRVHPISRPMQRFNDIGMAGHVTAACSPSPYRGDLFGPEYSSSIFVCEPVYNLVHREILEPEGVSFTSHRAADEQQSEFLASTDNWFRPVMVKTGPDGALYIADMYRQVLEHPEWIPADVKSRLDLRAGHDRGRIYRISPEGAERLGIPRLDSLDTAALVAALDSGNGWQRDTAQRLLCERADPQATTLLIHLFRACPRAKTRLQILGALEGLGGLDPEFIAEAFHDSHAAVREHAVRLSEFFLRAAGPRLPLSPESANKLLESLYTLQDDPSLRVRYQLAFTLGECSDSRAGEILINIALKEEENADLQRAVLSSARPHVGAMMAAVLTRSQGSTPKILDTLLGLAADSREEQSLAEALHRLSQPLSGHYAAWQLNGFSCLLGAIEHRGESLKAFEQRAGPRLRSSLQELNVLFADAREKVKFQLTAAELQPDIFAAVALLGHGLNGYRDDWELLKGLIQPRFSIELQRSALAALCGATDAAVGEILVALWPGCTPELRVHLLASLMARSAWTERLVAAIEAGTIPAGQIGVANQQMLLKNSNPQVRTRAGKLFGPIDPNRSSILAAYHDVAGIKPDGQRGEATFQQNCATCHAPQKGRSQVGPDLGALADKSVETLLVAIFDPNRAVESRYVNYTALTRDGREISGILSEESGNSITLISVTGETTILRSDLQQLTSSGLSLMPEGFEKILSQQDAADIIAYIRARAPTAHH